LSKVIEEIGDGTTVCELLSQELNFSLLLGTGLYFGVLEIKRLEETDEHITPSF